VYYGDVAAYNTCSDSLPPFLYSALTGPGAARPPLLW
jgi:hypothetical protein